MTLHQKIDREERERERMREIERMRERERKRKISTNHFRVGGFETKTMSKSFYWSH